jgi:hypothetical protein
MGMNFEGFEQRHWVLQAPHASTRSTGALATIKNARHDTGRGKLGQVGDPRRLALAKVPAILVGALADPPRAQTSRGPHLIAQHGPRRVSTLRAPAVRCPAVLLPAIIHRGIDSIRRRRISHSPYLVYSLAIPPVQGFKCRRIGWMVALLVLGDISGFLLAVYYLA